MITETRCSLAAAVAVALAPGLVSGAAAPVLEEIVVTANRRAENVLDVPYNISALSAETIESAGIRDLQGLIHLMPGVAAPDLGARATSTNSQIIIRGLNAGDAGASYVAPNLSVPLVSTYVDDTPMFVNLTLADIERVEVLRGPQGTLYGSGAVGGTVRLLHRRPDFTAASAEFSADVSKTDYAGSPSYGFGGVFNLPVSDRLALRVAAGYTQQAGYVTADRVARFDASGQPILSDPLHPLTSGVLYGQEDGIDRSHSGFVRGVLEWKVSTDLDAQLTYQRQTDFANGFSARTVGESRPLVHKFIPDEPVHRNVDLGALTLAAELGFATLTSSTSYYDNRYHDTVDLSYFPEHASVYSYGGYPRVASPIYTTADDKAFVEELRLVSRSGSSWDYVAGAFYRRQTTYVDDPQTLPGLSVWSELPGSGLPLSIYYGGPGASGTCNYDTAADAFVNCNGGARPGSLRPTDLVYDLTRNTTFHDKAVYGELTRHLSERWQITAGARVFWQNFGQTLHQITPLCGPACSTLDPPDIYGTVSKAASRSFEDHIFKLNSSYEFGRELHVYATWSQGFRHGGQNAFPVDPSGKCGVCELSDALGPYKSDRATNYEVGVKGAIDNRWRYSAALYRIDWTDIQLDTFLIRSFAGVVVNGGKARSQGLEFEGSARLSDYWSATAGFTLTDARLTSDFVNQQIIGHDGDRLPGVSRSQLSAAVDYVRPLGSRAVTFHFDGAYRSGFGSTLNDLYYDGSGFEAGQRSNYRLFGGYTVMNAALGLELGSHWRLRAYLDNLANVAGVAAWVGDHTDVTAHNNFEYLMRPRTVGLSVSYSSR
jgi:iron complex outermembrane recepter protein